MKRMSTKEATEKLAKYNKYNEMPLKKVPIKIDKRSKLYKDSQKGWQTLIPIESIGILQNNNNMATTNKTPVKIDKRSKEYKDSQKKFWTKTWKVPAGMNAYINNGCTVYPKSDTVSMQIPKGQKAPKLEWVPVEEYVTKKFPIPEGSTKCYFGDGEYNFSEGMTEFSVKVPKGDVTEPKFIYINQYTLPGKLPQQSIIIKGLVQNYPYDDSKQKDLTTLSNEVLELANSMYSTVGRMFNKLHQMTGSTQVAPELELCKVNGTLEILNSGTDRLKSLDNYLKEQVTKLETIVG